MGSPHRGNGRSLGKLLLAGLFFSASALANEGSALSVRKPWVVVGDAWTYRTTTLTRDSGRTVEKTEIVETVVTFTKDDVIHVLSKRKDQDAREEDARERDATFTSEWNLQVSGELGARPSVIVRPNGTFFKFPIKVGDTHNFAYEFVFADRGTLKVQVTVTALRWEEVTVPAGTFRALLVESDGFFEGVERPIKGRSLIRCWYVPEVRRWVRMVQEFGQNRLSSELIGVKLVPDDAAK